MHQIRKVKVEFFERDIVCPKNGMATLCFVLGFICHASDECPDRTQSATPFILQNQLAIQHVPTDDKGATIPLAPCQLYYITPAHQFPLGGVMPIDRRIDLLKWAEETEAYMIEDDYDSEFRYKGKPIPPLAQIDHLQRVIYFGTFSKTLMPSIRISYMILPNALVGKFNEFYRDQKTTVSKIDQLVIADFMRSGYYAKHIAKMRTLYRKKRQRLIEGIQTYLGSKYEMIGDEAGLHIILKLPSGLHEEQAIQLAREVGIAIDPVSSSYQLNSVKNYVMVGYGGLVRLDTAVKMKARKAKSWGYVLGFALGMFGLGTIVLFYEGAVLTLVG